MIEESRMRWRWISAFVWRLSVFEWLDWFVSFFCFELDHGILERERERKVQEIGGWTAFIDS
jgi:hypothetical protein